MRDEWLPAVVAVLVEVMGDGGVPAADITVDTRLDGDLGLDSIEVAALGDLLADRYGADLAGVLAGSELDALIALTVGDVADHLAGRPVIRHGATGS